MMQPETEIKIMKLVDGDLTVAQQNDLLAMCEIQPALYRDIALAYHEQAQLKNTFASHAILSQPAEAPSSEKLFKRQLSQWVSLAACVGLMIGFLSSSLLSHPPSSETVENQPLQPAPATDQDSGSYIFVFEPNPTEQETPTEAEIEEELLAKRVAATEEAVAQAMQQEIFDAASRQAFLEQGYLVEEEPVIYVIGDEQGRQFIFPQRKVSLQNVNYTVPENSNEF